MTSINEKGINENGTNEKGRSPIFSIIMPTHNRAHLVGRAIQSVLNQTLTDFELIVVDDASSDETATIAESFADERMIYLRQSSNQGVSAARNRGILQARGRFITFLDDDDESYPDLLAETLRAFEAESDAVGFAWSGIRRVQQAQDEQLLLRERRWSSERNRWPSLVYLGVGTGYGLTVRRSCFDVVGLFDEDIRSNVDTDILIRLGSKFDFTIVPGVHVTVYRHHLDQLTDLTPQRASAFERVIRKNADILEKNLRAWTRLHLKLAMMYYQIGDKPKGRMILLKMLHKRPARLSIWKYLLRQELGRAVTVEGEPSLEDD
ncbi:MAG: glycosyltransferase family 2 protein [Caldilineaceae bacterium]|nr:glycosyltransferase family 2 protein [Caldilineaceae bacterium]